MDLQLWTDPDRWTTDFDNADARPAVEVDPGFRDA
jgi:hypothetical protein